MIWPPLLRTINMKDPGYEMCFNFICNVFLTFSCMIWIFWKCRAFASYEHSIQFTWSNDVLCLISKYKLRRAQFLFICWCSFPTNWQWIASLMLLDNIFMVKYEIFAQQHIYVSIYKQKITNMHNWWKKNQNMLMYFKKQRFQRWRREEVRTEAIFSAKHKFLY